MALCALTLCSSVALRIRAFTTHWALSPDRPHEMSAIARASSGVAIRICTFTPDRCGRRCPSPRRPGSRDGPIDNPQTGVAHARDPSSVETVVSDSRSLFTVSQIMLFLESSDSGAIRSRLIRVGSSSALCMAGPRSRHEPIHLRVCFGLKPVNQIAVPVRVGVGFALNRQTPSRRYAPTPVRLRIGSALPSDGYVRAIAGRQTLNHPETGRSANNLTRGCGRWQPGAA